MLLFSEGERQYFEHNTADAACAVSRDDVPENVHGGRRVAVLYVAKRGANDLSMIMSFISSCRNKN